MSLMPTFLSQTDKTIHLVIVGVGQSGNIEASCDRIARRYRHGANIIVHELDGHSLLAALKPAHRVYIEAKLQQEFERAYGKRGKFKAFASLAELLQLLEQEIPLSGIRT